MNWLAHLRLSPPQPLVRIGNLCGDFVRGFDVAQLPADVQRGISMHRAMDRFVDAHAIVRASRDRLGPPFHRFRGVLLDVFFDHFLARDWQRWGDGRSLPAFAESVHTLLEGHFDVLPPRLAAALPAMRREQWLVGYAQTAGIDAILTRMAARSARAAPLAAGVQALRTHYAALEQDFVSFWPMLVAAAQRINAS